MNRKIMISNQENGYKMEVLLDMENAEKSMYTADQLICTNEDILKIALFNKNDESFSKGFAYIDGDYFYLYRGEMKYETKIPGIYKRGNEVVLVPVTTDEDKNIYNVESHIADLNVENIVNILKNNEDIYISLPDSSKMFIPPVQNTDDILKRAIKIALSEKGIDIDQYKSRFVDKNALFNFKQVVKGDTKLSMLLFERGTDALGLKYTIILEELDPELSIGNILKAPIIVSSEDTFVL